MNYVVRLIKVIGFTDCFSNCIARVKKLLLETDCICLACRHLSCFLLSPKSSTLVFVIVTADRSANSCQATKQVRLKSVSLSRNNCNKLIITTKLIYK